MLYTLHRILEDLANLYSKPQSPIHLSWRKNLLTKIFVAASEIIFSTPPDLMSCQQTPFQRTTLRLTMLLLGFPRGGMVVDRLLEALARDAGRGIVCTTTSIVALKCFLLNLLAFRPIAKIFSWRCDSHFQGEMRRGDGATALSGATIATNSHLQDTN